MTTNQTHDTDRRPDVLRRMLASVAAVLAVPTTTAAIFFTGAATASAPEPAWLDYDLTSTWAHATEVSSNKSTYGFLQSKNWTYHSWMWQYAGYPCIDYNAPAGTTLPGYLVASGNYVRCTGW